MLVNGFFEARLEQLNEVVDRLAQALEAAGIPYEIIGGLAVYFHVDRVDPLAARLTRDIDVLVRREDLERIARAAEPFGFRLRHAAGVDMLVDAQAPSARSAVHLVISGEKVRPESPEPAPPVEPKEKGRGAWIAPVSHLVRMKLTSFRLKDQTHIQDLDSVGLITPEIESSLSPLLRDRLAQVRRTE